MIGGRDFLLLAGNVKIAYLGYSKRKEKIKA
jgi:hypothetical protein